MVISGGLWGSPKACDWRNRFGGASEIVKGYLILSEQEETNKVYDAAGCQIGSLPFDLYLEQFTITYYDSPIFSIVDKNTQQSLYTLRGLPNPSLELEGGLRLEVLGRYKNLQLRRQQGRAVPEEGPAQIRNPGFELKLLWPDGTEEYYYVWEQNDFWAPPSNRCIISYSAPQMPRQYESRITVRRNGKSTVHSIRVNHPLVYGGYTFIQQSWGQDEKGYYSILGVVSNRGFPAVMTGYCLVMLGAAGHFWLIPLIQEVRKERRYSD
ncbi:MAG TPA: cytochrome c biogenesis protein ResB [Anaerohalosphaeraceae bacterium]|nr:cytochrome c biogenesis protein ResB [Anaerohalosphaeraceae bacterium]HOL88609.1 cytochrome c biogenesis protein ResB [Anaerohalosphaeraceae bacterium]HPP56244.1 cytochrome c biogenesis protein ResB [Anaerohalosphaeraceae bacterium]